MSAPPRPRAVVTGVGLFTPLGRDVDEVFGSLCAGRSGLGRPTEAQLGGVPVDVAALAPPLDATEVLSPTDARCVDRYVLMALAAAEDALSDAGLVVGRDVDPGRVAVVVSSGGGGMATYDEQARARHDRGHVAVSPYLLPGMLPNMAAARIAIRHGIRGVSSAIATACAAGAQAVAEGLRLVRGGEADVVVCGGADAPLHPTIMAAFANARALARGWDDPSTASRPFDRRRNGFVLGEGAGILVVERAEHADARGAGGYADLLGWGATTDAHHATMPRPDGAGAAECMRRALTDADVPASLVGYVNAHGTGTKLGDVAETLALRRVFGAHAPAVSSTKGAIGHLLGGAGAVEAAVTALALTRETLPPTRNLEDPDPECDADHVREQPRRVAVPAAMSNSFGFGGHNVSIVFSRATSRVVRNGRGDHADD